jgi:hypothetical protein
MTSTEEQTSRASLSERINTHALNLHYYSVTDIEKNKKISVKALKIKEVENLAVVDIKIQNYDSETIELIRTELESKLKPNDIIVKTYEGLNIYTNQNERRLAKTYASQ